MDRDKVLLNLIAESKNNQININKIYETSLSDEDFMYILIELEKRKIDIIEDIDFCEDEYFKGEEEPYYKQIKNYPVLTKEEERELFVMIENGDDDARDKIIGYNIKLAFSIAKKYLRRQRESTLDFMDLVQEGILGIIRGIETFEISKGYKFSTYVSWWINNSISRSIENKGKTIRLPVHMSEKLRKLNYCKNEFLSKCGREPNIEEYSDILGFNKQTIKKLLNLKEVISLNADVNDEDESIDLEYLISDQTDYIEKFIDQDYNSYLWSEIKTILTPREYEILLLRSGKRLGDIGSTKNYTLQQVANKLGLSRERIRMIEKKAYEKIKTKMK